MCVCNDELIPPLARSLVEENRVTRAHAGNSRRMEREEKNIKSTYATIEYSTFHLTRVFIFCLSALLIGKSPKQTLNLQRKAKSNLKF
jgi:hypothetical protein